AVDAVPADALGELEARGSLLQPPEEDVVLTFAGTAGRASAGIEIDGVEKGPGGDHTPAIGHGGDAGAGVGLRALARADRPVEIAGAGQLDHIDVLVGAGRRDVVRAAARVEVGGKIEVPRAVDVAGGVHGDALAGGGTIAADGGESFD